MRQVLEKFHQSPRRNKYEIWTEILDLCTGENIHLTYIMREIRLQTGKCKEYLKFLVERDLLSVIETEQEGIIYRTTVKGEECVKQFLEDINKYFM